MKWQFTIILSSSKYQITLGVSPMWKSLCLRAIGLPTYIFIENQLKFLSVGIFIFCFWKILLNFPIFLKNIEKEKCILSEKMPTRRDSKLGGETAILQKAGKNWFNEAAIVVSLAWDLPISFNFYNSRNFFPESVYPCSQNPNSTFCRK